MSDLSHPIILGSGPVGRAIVASLTDRGIKPKIISRSGTAVDGAESVVADVTTPGWGERILSKSSIVFQCAQPPYHRWTQEFPVLQRAILDECEREGSALVAVENTYGYGRVDGPMTEQTPFQPVSRKGEVRAEMSNELLDAHRNGRVRTAAVRASDFFGPHVEASAYGSRLFPALIAGKKGELLGDPDAKHSITYIQDLANALITVASEPDSWGRAWHAPTAPPVTQRQIIEIAAHVAGVEPSFKTMSAWQLRLAGLFIKEAKETVEMLYEFENDFVVDSSAFSERFKVEPTPLAESLGETVAWFQAHRS